MHDGNQIASGGRRDTLVVCLERPAKIQVLQLFHVLEPGGLIEVLHAEADIAAHLASPGEHRQLIGQSRPPMMQPSQHRTSRSFDPQVAFGKFFDGFQHMASALGSDDIAGHQVFVQIGGLEDSAANGEQALPCRHAVDRNREVRHYRGRCLRRRTYDATRRR